MTEEEMGVLHEQLAEVTDRLDEIVRLYEERLDAAQKRSEMLQRQLDRSLRRDRWLFVACCILLGLLLGLPLLLCAR